MSRLPRLLAASVVLGAALATAAGCGRNDAGTLLAPTGIRPAPATWPGSITGTVLFAPQLAPDLSAPPYPPTRLELYLGSELVAVDSLDASSRDYLFPGLAPATYSLVVRSTAFFTASRGGLPVYEGRLDAGNIALTLNEPFVNELTFITGTMPGYGVEQLWAGETQCNQNIVGVHTYPSDLAVPADIPAGTYRFKFVNDQANTTNTNLIGWGGSPLDTLTTPITDHLTVPGSGPSTDLVVRFPVTGVYAFTLDARRQRFSIALVPPAPGAGPPMSANRR